MGYFAIVEGRLTDYGYMNFGILYVHMVLMTLSYFIFGVKRLSCVK